MYRELVAPVDIAATFASILGVNAPSASVGRILTEALRPAPAREQARTEEPLHCSDGKESGHGERAARRGKGPKAGSKGPDMRVTVAGVEFRSPVIAASGTFGYGVEFEDIVSLDRIGGFVTKGLSREPMAGNPTPRIIETAAGMINAIGLQNMGVRAFIAEKLPKLRGAERHGRDCERLRLHHRGLPRGDPGAQRRAGHRHVRAERELPQHEPWRHGLRHRSAELV